jgi:hypothetical protein
MLNVSAKAFLDEDAAEDTDGRSFDLDLLGVSEPLGEVRVSVPDMKGPAVEAFVGNDQLPGATGRAGGFELSDVHRGISDLDVAPGFRGILPYAFDRCHGISLIRHSQAI